MSGLVKGSAGPGKRHAVAPEGLDWWRTVPRNRALCGRPVSVMTGPHNAWVPAQSGNCAACEKAARTWEARKKLQARVEKELGPPLVPRAAPVETTHPHSGKADDMTTKLDQPTYDKLATMHKELQEVDREIYQLTISRNALRLQINETLAVAGRPLVFDWDEQRGFRIPEGDSVPGGRRGDK